MFDEHTFPCITLVSKSPPSVSVSKCTSFKLTPLFTKNNTVISSSSSSLSPSLSHLLHSSSSYASSTSLTPQALESFIEPTSASESLNVPSPAPELFNIILEPNTSSNASKSLSPDSITATQSQIPADLDFQPENLTVVLPVSSINLYTMQTWSKSGIVKRKAYSVTATTSENFIVEPTTYKATSKIPKWQAAMQDKITTLHIQ